MVLNMIGGWIESSSHSFLPSPDDEGIMSSSCFGITNGRSGATGECFGMFGENAENPLANGELGDEASSRLLRLDGFCWCGTHSRLVCVALSAVSWGSRLEQGRASSSGSLYVRTKSSTILSSKNVAMRKVVAGIHYDMWGLLHECVSLQGGDIYGRFSKKVMKKLRKKFSVKNITPLFNRVRKLL